MENCIFCKIARGEIPCYKIYENEDILVILDAFPLMKGQTLIIPKKHIAPYLFDADNKIYINLMLIAKNIAKAIDKSLNPIKTGMIVEGLELEHVHIKLYPLKTSFGIKKVDKKPSEQEMKDIANKIKQQIK